MGITVYGYQVDAEVGEITGYGFSLEGVVDELSRVRAEIQMEDGYTVTSSTVYAFDLFRPDLDQLLAVLNRDAELPGMVLTGKRLVQTVEG